MKHRLMFGIVSALVAHDPSKVKLAPELKFVENAQRLKAGEGLWTTASAVPTAFALPVPDPVSGQIGFIGTMEESGKPIQLGLRLKVENGAITEAEHLVVRSFNGNSLDNLQSPAGGAGNGLDGQPRLGCHAQMDTRTFTYIDSIDFRRVWTADPVTGLVFGLSHFRHSMTNKEITVIGRDGKPTTRAVNFNPFDLPAAHIFKVRDNRIHEIEALGFMLPYMSKGRWSEFLR
jgi:hypothetical protein